MKHIRNIIGERPVGTMGNKRAAAYIEKTMKHFGYKVSSLPFSCIRWECGSSQVTIGNSVVPIFAGPFSPYFSGMVSAVTADSFENLQKTNISGKLLVLFGELAVDTLMPKNFPFFYPDEHRVLIEYLEDAAPQAILACTSKHPITGLCPFPVFEDGNFTIPNSYADHSIADLFTDSTRQVEITINSRRHPDTGRQLVATKEGTQDGKIVICAHMDTAYGTPGALDNATGVSILLHCMERLAADTYAPTLEFVPFNGEEYIAASGQLCYLSSFPTSPAEVSLAINVDGAGCRGSRTAVSTYHTSTRQEQVIEQVIDDIPSFTRGEQWVEGDHSLFAFQNIPSIALTSWDEKRSISSVAHTQYDTEEFIETLLIEEAADGITSMVRRIKER